MVGVPSPARSNPLIPCAVSQGMPGLPGEKGESGHVGLMVRSRHHFVWPDASHRGEWRVSPFLCSQGPPGQQGPTGPQGPIGGQVFPTFVSLLVFEFCVQFFLEQSSVFCLGCCTGPEWATWDDRTTRRRRREGQLFTLQCVSTWCSVRLDVHVCTVYYTAATRPIRISSKRYFAISPIYNQGWEQQILLSHYSQVVPYCWLCFLIFYLNFKFSHCLNWVFLKLQEKSQEIKNLNRLIFIFAEMYLHFLGRTFKMRLLFSLWFTVFGHSLK